MVHLSVCGGLLETAYFYLLSQHSGDNTGGFGKGMLLIPEKEVSEFRKLLVSYYEDQENGEIMNFMQGKCIKNF